MRKSTIFAAVSALGAMAACQSANAQTAVVVDEETIAVTEVPVSCKTNYSVNRTDNWFIQLGAGVDVPFVEYALKDGNPRHHFTAAYNLGVGKWFSPYVGFRFSGHYGAMHWDTQEYSKAKYANVNLDMMWDMCNSLGGVNASRPVSVVPFIGLGGTYVFDYDAPAANIYQNGHVKRNQWLLPVSAGIQIRFRLCRYADFFVEGRAGFYGDNFNNTAYGKPIDINGQVIGGFSFNLGGVNYQAYNECKDLAYIASLNNQVNDLRGELAATACALAAAQSQLPCPEVKPVTNATATVTAAPLMSTVRFTINSAKITNEEMVNVYNTAQYLKENPDVNVIIKGYADKDTGTATYNQELSQRRAQAVYDALTKTYGVAADRLTIDAQGSSVQPYDVNNWNRIVIFVPAE